MVSLTNSFKSGQIIPEDQLTFRICPGSIIDLEDTSVPLGFLPIEIPRLTIQCGDTGTRGTNKGEQCIFRGGGKRNSHSSTWNTYPQQAYKTSKAGILGGDNEAQIYVYGDSAYEITLRGLTFDNSVTNGEEKLYRDYVAEFGVGGPDGVNNENDDAFFSGGSNVEQEYDASVPTSDADTTSSSSMNNNNNRRNLQFDQFDQFTTLNNNENDGGNVEAAHRFASVAVRGNGFGDDAGPRLITIEDCRFESHRGYAILISPGIEEPDMPMAPDFDFSTSEAAKPHSLSDNDNNNDAALSSGMPSVNLQSSGQLHGGTTVEDGNGSDDSNNPRRNLNLLDDKFIAHDGLISYDYHTTSDKVDLDARRVKIIKTEFANNIITDENVAGLVTSAYSLTLTDCFFTKNTAKAMVFVYNNDAIVDNSIFSQNTVEVSTVILASPKGSKPMATTSASAANVGEMDVEPTHIVERTCFLGSKVGMSNVLVTDVENTGFGQRDNHATGTEFSWVSTCEGGAAEQFGNDCLESGNCDGTCVQFTSEKCMSSHVNSREYEMFFNAGYYNRRSSVGWLALLGMTIVCLL